MKAKKANEQTTMPALPKTRGRAHRRFGWSALFLALTFGAALEGYLGFRAEIILSDPLRRELWSMAHFHGAMLALLNLIYVPWADLEGLGEEARRSASRALLLGSTLLPLGFFFGGIAHPEGDPSIGIFLVPAGAALVLYAAFRQVLAAWRA